jgi:hypothetical protein
MNRERSIFKEGANLEALNPKQIQMTKRQKIPNGTDSDLNFGLIQFLFVSDFDIRISDFRRRRLCAKSF